MSDSDSTKILPPGLTPSGGSPEGSSPRVADGMWEPPTVEAMRLLLPAYEVRRVIGRGGMGAVYEGVQKVLDRAVAIKVLPPEVAQRDPHFVERFKRESRAMAKLSHPCIIAVHEAGETVGGMLFFVMELIDGVDVARIIESEGRLPPERVLRICRDVCDALMYAHAQGIVHRDVTPSNIIIDRQGRVKVADFGLAKLELEERSRQASSTVMGKPDFLAPEAFIPGIHIDGRADVYSLGVSLYQMLTGTLPRGRFELPSQLVAGVDERLDAIIDRAMQTDREKRYSSAAEVRSDLDLLLARRATQMASPPHSSARTLTVRVPGTAPAPRRNWPLEKMALAAGLAALAGVALMFWNQAQDSSAAGKAPPIRDLKVANEQGGANAPAPTAPVVNRPQANGMPTTLSVPVQTSSVRSKSQIRWQWRHPLPQGSGLMDLLWDGGRFIAVGDRSAIVTSSDGVEWQRQGTYDVPWLGGIASNGQSYVVCGASFLNDAPLLFSSDGESWSRLDFKSPDLEAVTWTGEQYVAVGRGGVIAVSKTGDEGWGGVIAGDSRYHGAASQAGVTVLVGSGGSIVVTTDGRRWMKRQSGVVQDLLAVAWAGSRWVAVGDAGTVLVSSDGATWEQRQCATSQGLQAVCWTGKRLIAGGKGGTAWISKNGDIWQPVPSGTKQDIQAIRHNDAGMVVAVCDRGMLLSSADEGANWQPRTKALTQNTLYGVAAAPDKVVTVGYAGVILHSADGVQWTPASSGTSSLYHVTWTGRSFMAVGHNGTILVSEDGSAWRSMSSGTTAPLGGIVCNGRSHVAVGAGGTILSSEDGRTWEVRQSNVTTDLAAVTWSGKEFVVVGAGGTMLRSVDGIAWENVSTPTDDDLVAVTWTGSNVVAVGFQDRALATSDFNQWQQGGMRLFDGRANAVLWHQGLALAVGAFGSCAVSVDFKNWLGSGTLVEPTGNDLNSACIFAGKVIAVGEAGTILSGDWFDQMPDFSLTGLTGEK
jgi:serine/threonine protein kinase/photosystem II stability/assembly factor-like uncharacterized protein